MSYNDLLDIIGFLVYLVSSLLSMVYNIQLSEGIKLGPIIIIFTCFLIILFYFIGKFKQE